MITKLAVTLWALPFLRKLKPGLPSLQAKLLASIQLLFIFFSSVTIFVVLAFNPHDDPALNQYALLIGGVIFCLFFSFALNLRGYHQLSAYLLVFGTFLIPWISLLIDPSILQGDFVPLTYIAFSIILSSILLPTRTTIYLVMVQFTGISFILIFHPAFKAFNWFSFLAFFLLISIFSILTNAMVQHDLEQITDQARQLADTEQRLREQSIRDHLTNLYNRRYLEETLNHEIRRATRRKATLGVVMIDVDRFKYINDTFGHAIGDHVLKMLSNFLGEHIRESDIACRYGGDEFVLVLPNSSKETIMERTKELQQGVKNLNTPVPLTISLGLAIFPEDGYDGEALLKVADDALYQAKHIAKDRIT